MISPFESVVREAEHKLGNASHFLVRVARHISKIISLCKHRYDFRCMALLFTQKTAWVTHYKAVAQAVDIHIINLYSLVVAHLSASHIDTYNIQ